MKIISSILSISCIILLALPLSANTPMNLQESHPRYLTTPAGKQETLDLISNETWAKEVFDKLRKRTDVYADKEPDWLTGRLQMYWDSHATEVYVNGEFYSHAGGEKAPYPTVMYTGARNHGTNYARPKLEDITPFQEDPKGLYLANNMLEGKPKEWASISKTGNIIQSINVEILGIARDAAFLWWLTDNEKYARLAGSVFDTYMTGIYYRNVPVDLNHGHQQTLVGMTSFEVIHEDAINALVPLYDFLFDYLKAKYPEKMDIYADAFKKWADNIIDNGVPHNNWDLIQARFILDIAQILEDDNSYSDRKGRQYYIDYVINQSSIRQWSLKKLADYGFDEKTGIWAECPGYSINVVHDYANMLPLFYRNLDIDLLSEIPILEKAMLATPQYLFPNRMIVGFGDTHPGFLRTDGIEKMISNAQKFGNREQEIRLTQMLRLFNPNYSNTTKTKNNVRVAVTSLFEDKPLKIDESINTGDINDYVTPVFYSPNVSWLVQRSGMSPSSLMVSVNGSEGNHMHANGINMELYGKGLPLGPDAGIGKTLYSGLDYLEYYSQFPAHNTVCVDGVSSYPVMKSNHSFDVVDCFPTPNENKGYLPVSYSCVNFIEPETQSIQTRINGIVALDSISGYYVDIFRSKKLNGKDKTHDYFYHNLGQSMSINEASGNRLDLKPTQELAFAGANLYAYSYLYDKKSAKTEKDIHTVFTVNKPDGDAVFMNMWMKGENNREIFSALSPMTEGLSRTPNMPYDIKEQPTLTFVARQNGEAWNKPFVAVYEPSTTKEPSTIMSVAYPSVTSEGNGSNVAIRVNHQGDISDLIVSSDDNYDVTADELSTSANYAVWRTADNKNRLIFMGNGTSLKIPGIKFEAKEPINLLMIENNGKWEYMATGNAVLTINKKKYKISTTSSITPLGK